MLVTLKEILKIAEEKNIAVGAFNAPYLESLQAVMSAAEEVQLPVIIQFAPVHETFNLLADMGPLMMEYAKRVSVPVCVHLDHGDTVERVQQALDMGFTGVMIDGSTLPYEENVALSKKVVEMAHAAGASVEAELGSMGRAETGSGEGTGANDETKIYTDPVLAKDFVAQTGIDALACSFGTTHGIYLTEPKLDFDVVKNVRTQTGNIPVVMHGGSGVSHDDYHTAIKSGVRKINYFTYMDVAGGAAAAEAVKATAEGKPYFFTEMATRAREGMKKNVMSAMKMFALQE